MAKVLLGAHSMRGTIGRLLPVVTHVSLYYHPFYKMRKLKQKVVKQMAEWEFKPRPFGSRACAGPLPSNSSGVPCRPPGAVNRI